MKTIVITGCSSGFGAEMAKHFLDRGWKVIATMRVPRDDVLPSSENLRIVPLDVTNPDSIRQMVEAAGPIDALVNNAGIGMFGALEGTSMQITRELFETNTLGVIALTQAILPRFRAQMAGVIVNITSSITLKPLPLLSVYTASKAAVNAFSESLALELEPFNVRVKLVMPGRAPETSFGQNARLRVQSNTAEAYASFAKSVVAGMGESPLVTRTSDVVNAVWRAVTDPLAPTRIAAGADALELAEEA